MKGLFISDQRDVFKLPIPSLATYYKGVKRELLLSYILAKLSYIYYLEKKAKRY